MVSELFDAALKAVYERGGALMVSAHGDTEIQASLRESVTYVAGIILDAAESAAPQVSEEKPKAAAVQRFP